MMDSDWTPLLPPGAFSHTVATGGRPKSVSRGPRLWPAGVVGSVTHAGGYCTVAMAPGDHIAAIGIDMEPLTPLPPVSWSRLFNAAEIDELLSMDAPRRGFDALARWCLKEALFKALQGCIPLDALPLSRVHDSWHPAPELHASLQQTGLPDPQRLVLRSAVTGGWQRAAVWYCLSNEH